MKHLLVTTLLFAAACAPQIDGLTITGLPVEEAQVRAAVALVNALQYSAPVVNSDVALGTEIDFVTHINGGENRIGATQARNPGALVEVVPNGNCLARSALIHELLHVKYGDGAHKLPRLWNVEVYEMNNKMITMHCPTEIHDGGQI